jgi:hypothetical protein
MQWLDLAAGVELAMKNGETLRELRLKGPGRFLVCTGGAEVVHIARGGLESTAGPGAHAGAAVLLATPFAVVEYADAELALEVRADKLVLDVRQGSAALGATTLEERPATPPPKPVRPPAGHFDLAGKFDAAALVSRCVERMAAVREGATAAPKSGSERGRWAREMVEKRQAVRLLCSRARAAAGTLDGIERTRLEDLLSVRNSAAATAPDPSAGAGTDAGK